MATEVSIQMFGDEWFRRRIQMMRYRARDMKPVLHDIGEDWLQIIEEQFATEGGRSGRKWAELKIETAAKRGSAHPILVDSATMLLEMTGPDNLDVSDDSVTIRLPEGVVQRAESAQYGFHTRSGGFVEPRRMLEFTDLDRESMRNKLTDYLVSGDRTQ